MSHSAQRTLPLPAARPAYRTLQGWALGTLIEQGAVEECEHHGHRRDRSDPDAWNRATRMRILAAVRRRGPPGRGMLSRDRLVALFDGRKTLFKRSDSVPEIVSTRC